MTTIPEPATTAETPQPNFRRAVVLMSATSFLLPLGGLVTAPVIARALGADGRGEMAAALAPAALMLNVATLGLPDAVPSRLATRPRATRVALVWSSLVTVALGAVCVAATLLVLPFLSAGDQELGELILFAAAWTIPALVVGVFRGAAIGRQMWVAVSLERAIQTVLRVGVFTAFWLLGILDVFTAVALSVAFPIVVGLVYLGLLRKPPPNRDQPTDDPRVFAPVMRYGAHVWLGSVASMLLNRLAPLLMVPLSTAADLGLYTVATTISDVPLIVALAVQSALFGVNSQSRDAGMLTATARLTLLLGFIGSGAMALTVPLWVVPLFGAEFADAVIPTIMLLASAVICIPSLMAAGALSAWGRPGLRSLGLVVTLVVNLLALVLTVPTWGVYGACWTSILSNVVMSLFMVIAAARVLKVSGGRFVLVGGADVRRLYRELVRVMRRVLRRRR